MCRGMHNLLLQMPAGVGPGFTDAGFSPLPAGMSKKGIPSSLSTKVAKLSADYGVTIVNGAVVTPDAGVEVTFSYNDVDYDLPIDTVIDDATDAALVDLLVDIEVVGSVTVGVDTVLDEVDIDGDGDADGVDLGGDLGIDLYGDNTETADVTEDDYLDGVADTYTATEWVASDAQEAFEDAVGEYQALLAFCQRWTVVA